MNRLDIAITEFFNQFINVSWAFDGAVRFISGNNLVKAGVLLAIVWWAWFRGDKNQRAVQAHLLATLFACIVSIATSRLLSATLPFRNRPLYEESLGLVRPDGMSLTILQDWSSFPSDHAALFYALSAGMFYISRRTGWFAIIFTTILIAFPRVYLGLHYCSDIIGGAIVGITVTLLVNRANIVEKHAYSVAGWSAARPELFYPLFFLLTYQMADLFNNGLAFADALNRFIAMAAQTQPVPVSL